MDQVTQQNDISNTLGLGALSDEEKIVFLSEIGDVVLDAALLRLVADFTDDQQEALNQFLETEPEPDVLMKHLLDHHKNFEPILQEEIAAFQAETEAVFAAPESTATAAN